MIIKKKTNKDLISIYQLFINEKNFILQKKSTIKIIQKKSISFYRVMNWQFVIEARLKTIFFVF